MINTKALFQALLTRVIGFLVFLVLLVIANVLVYYIKNNIFSSVVLFLNQNIWLIIIFTIILLIGEIFGYLFFPLNIPAPLFNAVGGVFLVQFVFKMLIFIFSITNINFPLPLDFIENITIAIVFVAVIVVGYVDIIRDATRPKKRLHMKEKVHMNKNRDEED